MKAQRFLIRGMTGSRMKIKLTVVLSVPSYLVPHFHVDLRIHPGTKRHVTNEFLKKIIDTEKCNKYNVP